MLARAKAGKYGVQNIPSWNIWPVNLFDAGFPGNIGVFAHFSPGKMFINKISTSYQHLINMLSTIIFGRPSYNLRTWTRRTMTKISPRRWYLVVENIQKYIDKYEKCYYIDSMVTTAQKIMLIVDGRTAGALNRACGGGKPHEMFACQVHRSFPFSFIYPASSAGRSRGRPPRGAPR